MEVATLGENGKALITDKGISSDGPAPLTASLTQQAFSLRSAGSEDESVRDLRRAVIRQVSHNSDIKRPSQTPPELRPASELLDPDLGRLRDVAQPGGFRRHHVRQVTPGGMSGYVRTPLLKLMQPEIMLAFVNEDPSDLASDGVPDPHSVAPRNSASFAATFIVILKCSFGSAILIVPHGYRVAGFIGGPLCLIVVYVLMVLAMLRLVDCCRDFPGVGIPKFQDLGASWGSWGSAYISWAIVSLTVGFNCIWCVTCQENFRMIAPEWSDTRCLWIFLPAVALLSLVRHLAFFTITNFLGIICCLATAVYLAYFAIEEASVNGTKPIRMYNIENADTLLWLGTCGYIFELICCVPPIYEAAADKDSVQQLLILGTGMVVVVYLFFGFLFYHAFGDQTAELATLNLEVGSFEGKLFPFLFSLVGIVTMPVNSFIIFQVYEPLLTWSVHYRVRKWQKNFLRMFVVFCFYFLTWVGGSQLQNFLALVGGLLGANLSMLVPAGLHLAICKPQGFTWAMDVVICVFGLFMMVLCTYQSVMTWH